MNRLGILFLGALIVGGCSSSEEGGGGATGGSGGKGGGAGGGKEVAGCGDTKLLEVPADPAVTGPSPVGVKTLTLDLPGGLGGLDVEVWYPAKLGSDKGATPATYDIRDWLPPSEKVKISDAKHGPPQGVGGFRDLPLDDAHGPYPLVIHIHGTAAFRTASAGQTVHWASRGFIVVAADHPGMYLGDMLAAVSGGTCTGRGIAQDVNRDVDTMLAALTGGTGGFTFLSGALDTTRVGIAGHSQGAGLAAGMTNKPGVRVVMPLATGAGTTPSPTLESTLILSGMSDAVVPYTSDQAAYAASPKPKRLVGISNTGHLAMSDLCGLRNPEGKDLVAVGQETGVCGMNLASALWDCSASYLSQEKGTEIINYATAAALEEKLHCADHTSAFAGFQSKYSEVGEFKDEK